MINDELVTYIRKQKEMGVPELVYKQSLFSQGWTEQDIREALTSLEHASTPLVSPAPSSIKKTNSNNKFLVFLLVLIVVSGSVMTLYLFNKDKSNRELSKNISAVSEDTTEPTPTTSTTAKTTDTVDTPETSETQANQTAPIAPTSPRVQTTSPKESSTSVVGDNEVKIVSPVAGTKFLGGAKITFTVVAGKNVKNLLFLARASNGTADDTGTLTENKMDIKGGTFNFDYIVPKDALGEIVAYTLSMDSNASSSTLKLEAYTNAKLVSLMHYYEESSPIFTATGSLASYGIAGMYDDGQKRDIPANLLNITFKDQSVASVEVNKDQPSASFGVKGLKKGDTVMTASYMGKSFSVPVQIYQ